MSAVPKRPEPIDWLAAAADEMKQGDAATLKILQESYRNINRILKGLPSTPDAPLGQLIYRAQLERTKKALLDEQANLFDKLGDKVGARRLRSASRAAKLSRAADAAYLGYVGNDEDGKKLYDGAKVTAQRTLETILARTNISRVPLAERIYNTKVWMNGRLDRLIGSTMAAGLNAQRFARVARDWFSPSTPGGTRYAAMRLARTEINNAFHATTLDYARSKPWVDQMEWHLSKSHPGKDKCDLVAAGSPYKVTEVPRKPHPQCMCYVTEAQPSFEEWADRFAAGEFDDYLNAELAKADGTVPVETPTTATGAQVTTLKPEPQPEQHVAPVTVDAKGYVPGNWQLQTDNEVRIQSLMADLAVFVPKERHGELRQMAEKLINDTTEDTDLEYHNGPHVIRFTGNLDEEQRKTFIGYFDQLQTTTPTGRDMFVTVAPSTDFEYGVGGETTLATGYMRINESVMSRKVWPGMPASADVSSAMYVLAHEWGHSFPSKEDARDQHIHNDSIGAGGMTRYGMTAPEESYAEAFAEWVLTGGRTTNKAAQAYAKRFNWGERFGI